MNSFVELVNDMKDDMDEQQGKIDSFTRTVFQWLDRILLDIDPSAIPSEFSSFLDTETYCSNEYSNNSLELMQTSKNTYSSDSQSDLENNNRSGYCSFGANEQRPLQRQNENSIMNIDIIDKSKQMNKLDGKPSQQSKLYYFGMSEYANELSEDANKFTQKWQETITEPFSSH